MLPLDLFTKTKHVYTQLAPWTVLKMFHGIFTFEIRAGFKLRLDLSRLRQIPFYIQEVLEIEVIGFF